MSPSCACQYSKHRKALLSNRIQISRIILNVFLRVNFFKFHFFCSNLNCSNWTKNRIWPVHLQHLHLCFLLKLGPPLSRVEPNAQYYVLIVQGGTKILEVIVWLKVCIRIMYILVSVIIFYQLNLFRNINIILKFAI